MNTTKPVTDAAGIAISAKEQREILELYEKLREALAKLVGPDGKMEVLPNNVYSFLCRLLADLKAGSSVTICRQYTTNNDGRKQNVRSIASIPG